ncbi:MAG: NAD(P)-dependent oxidoreductase, partial [Saprospiraceae bacterium]
HLVDRPFIDQCQPRVIIINTSRGHCIKTEDLVEALETGRVGGACLDVFENEKPGTFNETEKAWYSRLYALENVVLSPHVAGWTQESKRRLAEVLLAKITVALADGQ